jgi:hypothetical protein
MGGRITSFTDANLEGDGLSERTLEGRDGMVLPGIKADKTPNTTSITAEQYWNTLGGRNTPVGEMFTYSASNIRLRELVLTYNIPQASIDRTPIKVPAFPLPAVTCFSLKMTAKDSILNWWYQPIKVLSVQNHSACHIPVHMVLI